MEYTQLYESFNTPDVQLVVSGWPSRAPGTQGYHGDAAFTRETLLSLVKTKHMRFVVIAETNHDNRPELVGDGNILVLRVINHDKFHVYPTILTWLNRFPAIKHVTVHSNFTYSGIAHFILLVPFLALIKLTGRKLSLVAHNVVDSIDFLAKQINITNKLLVAVLNSGVRFYNNTLGMILDHVIVLDIQGKKIMQSYVPANKIVYNPHFVKPRNTTITMNEAKQSLGISSNTKVLLCFGFISYYKGSDILAELFKKSNKNKNFHLIFAGGPSPSLSHTKHYQEFFDRFEKMVSKVKNITYTGFIPTNKVGMYFAAADLVVLPYRGLMGGSGAFSYAVGYGKPAIISTPMHELTENPDINRVLCENKLQSKDIEFNLTKNGFNDVLKIAENKTLLNTLTQVSEEIRTVRNIDVITNQLYDEVYAPDYHAQFISRPAFAGLHS